jgi:hypothetical protein
VLGVGLYKSDSTVVEGNRLTFNPPTFTAELGAGGTRMSQMKIFRSVGVVVRSNTLEDGAKKGIWFDTDNYLAVIESNTVRRQGQACIWYEAGYAAMIRGNDIDGCGLATSDGWVGNAGIQVTNSYPVEIAGNTVTNAENGITGMAVGAAANPDYTTGSRGLKALGIHVHDNTVTQAAGKATGVRASGTGADTAFTWSGRSTFERNHYRTTTWNPYPFTWSNANKTAGQWQALGFDDAGTFAP